MKLVILRINVDYIFPNFHQTYKLMNLSWCQIMSMGSWFLKISIRNETQGIASLRIHLDHNPIIYDQWCVGLNRRLKNMRPCIKLYFIDNPIIMNILLEMNNDCKQSDNIYKTTHKNDIGIETIQWTRRTIWEYICRDTIPRVSWTRDARYCVSTGTCPFPSTTKEQYVNHPNTIMVKNKHKTKNAIKPHT